MSWRPFRARVRDRALLLCFGVNDNFLSHLVLPISPRLPLGPGATPERVLRQLPRGCRLVLPALNLTQPWRLLPAVDVLHDRLRRRGIRLLNAPVRDQGKRALQGRLARLGLPRTAAEAAGDPEELLLVKTELNSGALVERELSPPERRRLGLADPPPYLPTRDSYPLLPRRQVPPAWFVDPWLHVERFVCRPDGLTFRLLQAGRRGALMVRRSALPIARSAQAELIDLVLLEAGATGWDAERLADPCQPSLLVAAWRVAGDCGLEFGALDIVVDPEGRPHVIDLNVTPHQSAERTNTALNAYLRDGLLES